MTDLQKLVLLLAGGYAVFRILQSKQENNGNAEESYYPPFTSPASPGVSFWDAAGVRTPLAFRGQGAMVIPGVDRELSDMNIKPLFDWFGNLFDGNEKSQAKDYYKQGQVMNKSNEYKPMPPTTAKASPNSAQFSNNALPRGIRNNNPGNIRHGDAWQGRRPKQTDNAFVQFVSPEYGIRAMVKVLQTYQDSYGINTIEGIISRWAPPVENDTESYIESVVMKTGVSRDAPIDIGENRFTRELVRAIIYHENGTQPYNVAVIMDGIALAT